VKGHTEVAALLRTASPPARGAAAAPRQDHPRPNDASADLCETGIKMIDLFAPLRHGDLVVVDGDHGLGLVVLLGELTLALREGGYGHALWTGFEQPLLNRIELDHALGESGRRGMADQALVPQHLEGAEAEDELQRILGRWERKLARSLERRLVVLFQAAGRVAAAEALQPRLTRRGAGAATAFVVAPERFPPRGAQRAEELPPGAAAHLRFDAARPRRGLFPALRATALASANLSTETVGAEHAAAAREARALLASYERIDPDLAFPVPASLPARQRTVAVRAQRLHAFLTQPFFFAEPFTGKPGVRVARAATVQGVARILSGQMDDVPVHNLSYIGSDWSSPGFGAPS
jgi:F-type H+-transporting ATPase subunit beta